MSLLSDIIDGSTDDNVSTSNLLRKVQIAATYLGATAIIDWTRGELNGYADSSLLPSYRVVEDAPAYGVFTGPAGSRATVLLTALGAPDILESWFVLKFSQPLSEIEHLSKADEDPKRAWNPHAVNEYEKSGALRMQMMGLFSAYNPVARQLLVGIIDTVRNKALEFALELQQANPEAGSFGGPTVKTDSDLAPVIYSITNNITGHGTNIATGSAIEQKSSVTVGDPNGLRQAAVDLGLDEEAAAEFVAAVVEDGQPGGAQTMSFVSRVASGALSLGNGVASNLVATGLIDLASQFFGS